MGRRRTSDKKIDSSFLSCEKDLESIVEELFLNHGEHSELLKALLIINTKDVMNYKYNPTFETEVKKTNIKTLREKGYLRIEPKIKFGENEEVKSYIVISFDGFTPNASNEHYRDCMVMIDVICHSEYWDIGNFRLRPIKIAGIIDGILNEARLSGIGTLKFAGCNETVLSENLSGYCLTYAAVHGVDDILEPEEEE